MEQPSYIRHDTPHKYDQLPFGSEVVVKKNNTYELYQQISKDNENPHWIKMGNLTNPKTS